MTARREDHTIRATDGRRAARDHLAQLRERGGTYRAIAKAAGVGPMTVHGIATGHRQVTGNTAAAVLAVTSDTLPRARLDAGGSRLRLRALHVIGHSSARIARAAGASDKTIRKLLRGDAKTISPRLRDAIADLYDTWWDKRAPERTRGSGPPPAPPGGAPSPGTGAPAPAWTTTSWTSRATGPSTAGSPPAAPAPPPTSTREP
jgi:transcriptional regulator with XRE-family HTH domain